MTQKRNPTRVWRALAILTLGGVACSLFSPRVVGQELFEQDLIRAERVEVLDEHGETKILLEVTEDGTPRVLLAGARGKEAAVLTPDGVVFYNEHGGVGARLQRGSLGISGSEARAGSGEYFTVETSGRATSLSMSAGEGSAKQVVFSVRADPDGTAQVELGGGPGRGRIDLRASKGQLPGIHLFGPDGTLVWRTPVE